MTTATTQSEVTVELTAELQEALEALTSGTGAPSRKCKKCKLMVVLDQWLNETHKWCAECNGAGAEGDYIEYMAKHPEARAQLTFGRSNRDRAFKARLQEAVAAYEEEQAAKAILREERKAAKAAEAAEAAEVAA